MAYVILPTNPSTIAWWWCGGGPTGLLEALEIKRELMPKYTRVPSSNSLHEILDGFLHRWGFPQTVAAIDGTHIPISKPQDSAADYYNRKGYYSVLM